MLATTPVAPVVYSISVNGQPVRDFPLDVEVRQSFGLHEMAFIRIEYSRSFSGLNTMALWPENGLVRMVWGRGTQNLATFYGYVNHHRINSNADSGTKATQVEYVCIGTSKPMNSEATRTWGQVSGTYMAKTIAAEHGLRPVLTATSVVLDYEVQSAESDLAFLNRMAAKTGYRFWVSGGSLYFIDPAVVLAASARQGIPTYRLDKQFTQMDSVRDFEVLQGDNLPGAVKAQRVIHGVDQNTGQPFTVTADGTSSSSITKIQTGRVAKSVAEAKALVNAWAGLQQFWVMATAELWGNAVLYPGKLVHLTGSAMPGGTAGYWMVASADHLLKKSGLAYTVSDRYVTRVGLVRNQAASTPAVKQITPVQPEFVPCLHNGALWVAQSLTPIYDGRLS
jgi:phage protein D